MSGNNFTDKVSEFVGKAKEAVGDAINNEELAAEGRAEQSGAGQVDQGGSANGGSDVSAEEDFNTPIIPGNNPDEPTGVGEETFPRDAEDVEVNGPVGSESVPEAEGLPVVEDPDPADIPEGFSPSEDPVVVGDAGDFGSLDEETRFLEAPDSASPLSGEYQEDPLSESDFMEGRDERF